MIYHSVICHVSHVPMSQNFVSIVSHLPSVTLPHDSGKGRRRGQIGAGCWPEEACYQGGQDEQEGRAPAQEEADDIDKETVFQASFQTEGMHRVSVTSSLCSVHLGQWLQSRQKDLKDQGNQYDTIPWSCLIFFGKWYQHDWTQGSQRLRSRP